MPRDYAGEFREDLKEFHEMTKKFYQKEVNIAEYREERDVEIRKGNRKGGCKT